jgi:hypothetical protein
MKRFASLLLCSGLLALAADKQTFSGTVTDTMCGAEHSSMHMGSDEKCATECAKMGAEFALYDGHNTYELTDQVKAAKFAAKRVVVTGTLDQAAKVIKVETIAAAK